MPKVHKLGHVALYAKDAPLLTEFYRDLFDLTVTARAKSGKLAFLAVDPAINHHDLAIVSSPGAEHIAFYVDTLDEFRAFHAQLKARQIPVLNCQMVMFAVRLDFRDPEGNIVEVIWPTGKWGRFPFFRAIDLDAMSNEDILRIVEEMPLENQTT